MSATLSPASAQVEADGSLSTQVVTSDQLNFVIQQGDRLGDTLFHSFDSFSVPTNGSVSFTNTVDIDTIVSRVTGDAISQIDGLLQANGTADVFLLNANGIVFGPNAQLDIGGAFTASTASQMTFADGSTLSSVDPTPLPLVRVAVPVGLQYGPDGAASAIVTQGVLASDTPLTLAAGELDLQAGLAADGGAALSALGDVRLDGYSGGSLQILAGGDVQLSGGIQVLGPATGQSAAGQSGSETVTLSDGSAVVVAPADRAIVDIRTGIDPQALGGQASPDSGNLSLVGTLTVDQPNGLALLTTQFQPNPQLGGGDITVLGEMRLDATNPIEPDENDPQTQLNRTGLFTGNGGDVILDAAGDIDLTGNLVTSSFQQGDAGDVRLLGQAISFTDNLGVEGRNVLRANSDGLGRGGDVRIAARGPITLNQDFRIYTSLGENGIGRSGNVSVSGESLTFMPSSSIRSNTFGQGDAGYVDIETTGAVEFRGTDPKPSSVLTSAEVGARGDAGRFSVRAESLLVDFATIQTNTLGFGDVGDVSIQTRGDVTLVNSEQSILSRVNSGAVGNGGLVEIDADTLTIDNGARIIVRLNGVGQAGDVRIAANRVEVSNEGRISSETTTAGDGGTIDIAARDAIVVSTDGFIESNVGGSGSGNGGTIRLSTDRLELSGGGRIEVNTEGFRPAVLFDQLADASYSDTVIGDTPSAYWSFDEASGATVLNRAGTGVELNGNVVGTVLRGGDGVAGNAVQFDGQTGSVIIAAPADSDLDIRDSDETIGIEAWIKPDRTLAGNRPFFSIKGSDNTSAQTATVSVNTATDLITLRYFEGQVVTASTAQVESINGWYHVVVTVTPEEGDDSASIAINGRGINTARRGVPLESLQAPTFSIGSAQNPLSLSFSGQVDEVAVYRDDAVLNGKEIVEHYFLGRRNLGDPMLSTLSADGADAGNIQVDANTIDIRGVSATTGRSSGLFSGTEDSTGGRGGNIAVKTDVLSVSESGVLSAVSENDSPAGSIVVAADDVELAGGGQIISTASASGGAGNVDIDTDTLSIEGSDGGFAQRRLEALSSEDDDLEIDTVQANSGIAVSSNPTASGMGGTVDLTVDELLLLQDGGSISAAAGFGDGGNVSIDAGFVVASPGADSDITASAETGRGGNITINTQGLFNLEERQAFPNNGTNDIDASSEFGLAGQVTISTPELDPSRDVVELSTTPIDPSSLISRSCRPGAAATQNRFSVVGRGGLPSSPVTPISPTDLLDDLGAIAPVDLEADVADAAAPATESPSAHHNSELPSSIIEARGWASEGGRLRLTAMADGSARPTLAPAHCRTGQPHQPTASNP